MSRNLMMMMLVMGLALTGCVSTADSNALETVAQARALSGVLGAVSDENSATVAAPTVERIGRRLSRLAVEKQAAGDPSPYFANMLDNELPAVRQEIAERATNLRMNNPAALQIVGEALTKGISNPGEPTPELPALPSLGHLIPHGLGDSLPILPAIPGVPLPKKPGW